MEEMDETGRKYLTESVITANFLLDADAFEILVNKHGLPVLHDHPDPSGELCVPWDEELWDWCNKNPDLATRIGINGIYWFQIDSAEEKQPQYVQSSFEYTATSSAGCAPPMDWNGSISRFTAAHKSLASFSTKPPAYA